jgi:hypothetical protein
MEVVVHHNRIMAFNCGARSLEFTFTIRHMHLKNKFICVVESSKYTLAHETCAQRKKKLIVVWLDPQSTPLSQDMHTKKNNDEGSITNH